MIGMKYMLKPKFHAGATWYADNINTQDGFISAQTADGFESKILLDRYNVFLNGYLL